MKCFFSAKNFLKTEFWGISTNPILQICFDHENVNKTDKLITCKENKTYICQISNRNMSRLEGRSDSLMTTYIKRAYWAVNCIHSKIFFNQAGKTYVTPDREDEIVAMLTEQDPVEVALLRITRELVERAEKEQPEKKLNITKQSKDTKAVKSLLEQTQTQNRREEKEQQTVIKIEENQED